VGLVLSGGGALGLSHIGVIKALEENNIPIDYITGTSAGALVGSLYASGFSPLEMEQLVGSELFLQMAYGKTDDELDYYFRKPEDDPSLLQIWFEKEFSISKVIPTNLTNSALLDYEFMTNFSGVSKAANYNFNNLFVPFRCVAADVNTKKAVVFSKGHLNQAVRASMTYPGYLRPIKVDGKLMFDGGLYNNFPSDVMYDDFFPDIIIGVNLSDSLAPPDEDDVFSQLKSMVINRSSLSVICENGVLISPKISIGTFDFEGAQVAVKEGYNATIKSIEEIKKKIERRVNTDSLTIKRASFKAAVTTTKINTITIEGVSNNQAKYIKKALIHSNEIDIDFETLRKRFFKLLADEKIKSLYPIAIYNSESKKYEVKITVIPQKPFTVKFGGVFSSRPINTGYFGLEYFKLGKIGMKLNSDIHFGKYYGSTGLGLQTDFNTRIPFYFKAFGVLNNWDYFRSFTTFFDAVKPSYIIQNESFFGGELGIPISKRAKLTFSSSLGANKDSYYQTDNFTASDTADITSFTGQVHSINLNSSSLNRKLYASQGYKYYLSAKLINGTEDYSPGSTSSIENDLFNVQHSDVWVTAHLEQYFNIHKNIKLGLEVEGVNNWTNQFYSNYTATVLNAPIYQPFPESRTHLYTEYASHGYLGFGAKLVTPIRPNIDLRGELYLFRPTVLIEQSNTKEAVYNYDVKFQNYAYMISAKVVFHSPIGPLALAANYYDAELPNNPWSISINYGYILFNRRFIK
jgi:NTE family protein